MGITLSSSLKIPIKENNNTRFYFFNLIIFLYRYNYISLKFEK